MSYGIGEVLANLMSLPVLIGSVVVATISILLLIFKRESMKNKVKAVLAALGAVAIAVTIFLVVAMFAFGNNHPAANPVAYWNTIAPAALTVEQQDIIDLLSAPNQEMRLYDFNTDGVFRSFEVWVEIYQDGVLVERPAGLGIHRDLAETSHGRLAVTITENNSSYQFILSMMENGGKSSHIGTAEITIDSGFGRAHGPMNESAVIEDGKEIIIYSSTFQEVNVPHHVFDEITYQERPELLNEYPYAFLVKCKFSA